MAYSTIFRSLDKGLFEFIGPSGFSYALFSSAQKMKHMQIGDVSYYAYLITMFIFVSLVALNPVFYIL